jgi:alkylation response protein AidB-like acyl-CoA dehydrogenase
MTTATGLAQNQQQIQSLAREFAMKEVLPIANELDPRGEEIPQELIDKMGEVGFFGVMLP